MERPDCTFNQKAFDDALTAGEKQGGLTGALAARLRRRHHPESRENFFQTLTKTLGKPLNQIHTPQEFWHPELKNACAQLGGSALAERFPLFLEMLMEGRFSSSPSRRSYRSGSFVFYLQPAIAMLEVLIQDSYVLESPKERLQRSSPLFYTAEYPLALAIRQGDQELIQAITQALTGDNSAVLLSHEVIAAIIISGDPHLLELLLALLKTAKLQEGLRQAILESADTGSTATLIRILKLCLDEDLFRYSSTVRAFCAWTGLNFNPGAPAKVTKYAALAYTYLTDEEARHAALDSLNNLETYLALWAQGCYEVAVTMEQVRKLLDDPHQYRQALGWRFVRNSDSPQLQMALAGQYLHVRNEPILAWITECLVWTNWLIYTPTDQADSRAQTPVENPAFPGTPEERQKLFDGLREVALFIGKRTTYYPGEPFEGSVAELSIERVMKCMLSLAGHDMNAQMITALMELSDLMSGSLRSAFICHFLTPQTEKHHRVFLLKILGDRDPAVKSYAVKRLSHCDLDAEALTLMAQSLRSKKSTLRQAISSIFQTLNLTQLLPVTSTLLSSDDDHQMQAGIEILLTRKEDCPELLQHCQQSLALLQQKKLSTQTRILLDQFLPEQEEIQYTPENGFGLYDPAVVQRYLEQSGQERALRQRQVPPLSAAELQALIPTKEEIEALLTRLDQVFTRHADHEVTYLSWDGTRNTVLFGDNQWPWEVYLPESTGCETLRDKNARLEMVPFWPEFLEAFGDYARDVRKMLGLYYVCSDAFFDHCVKLEPWFLPIAELHLSENYHGEFRKKFPRLYTLTRLINKLPWLFDLKLIFTEALLLHDSMVAVIGEENLGKVYACSDREYYGWLFHSSPQDEKTALNHKMLSVWRNLLRQISLSDADFRLWFTTVYRLERLAKSKASPGLPLSDYLRACSLELIPQDVLMDYLLDPRWDVFSKIHELSNPNRWPRGRELYAQYPWIAQIVGSLLDTIASIEEKRGELPTVLTPLARAIERFEGAHHFCALLAALGKEKFFRGYEFASNDSKQAVLSHLLKACYPTKDDTPEKLSTLLKQTDIRSDRLVEAVMYAPQWAGFAETILDWPGLKCGVWFFHAHINEAFSAEKETETAVYSPISPQQFNDGAFDKDWFFRAYALLGEKRFGLLYKSAKYITTGSIQHRRSQLYVDAVLGRLDGQALRQEIAEKRNQDKLRCYPLLPMTPGDTEEALRRYEFIQKFLKESKQFGAQRRESEKKACNSAMENLAITTGVLDTDRLTWQMEGAKLQSILPLTEPQVIEGVTARLTFAEDGDATVHLEKDGKTIKTPPKTLSKHPAFLELKETVKSLKEQKRRARNTLERAMISASAFAPEELLGLLQNPVLSPMVRALVWVSGEQFGLPVAADGTLALSQADGTLVAVSSSLRIAHPHDLRQGQVWADFMGRIYRERIVQPFKQVFREYYPLTEDERQERTISRRYAGHQVQPKRTMALLRSRGWTVDYEMGLQRVFHKEELIARTFALADWFSPSDIEAPTLETTEFFHRSTGQHVPLEEVPPILFSEVMRDLDLVVSVAHIGGVDPEASHSTVEMRTAIARELVSLLRLDGVSWTGSHARIHGKLANYSVHLGSGVVHAEGIGMLAILPVHSQARGRVFLPFADDDPKTAEILSKIILLAEDHKLKDPSILQQLH